MNIAVLTSGGKVIVRPDTTWERDNDDLYVPEFVNWVSWTPAMFVRVSRAGRFIDKKFADRYYDAGGCGMLLYPENLIDGSQEGFACASCLDHTSFLPDPVIAKDEILSREGIFSIRKDGEEIFNRHAYTHQTIAEAIARVTSFCLIRRGDLIAIEMQARNPLCDRSVSRYEIKAEFLNKQVLDFNVIF